MHEVVRAILPAVSAFDTGKIARATASSRMHEVFLKYRLRSLRMSQRWRVLGMVRLRAVEECLRWRGSQ